MTKFRGRRSAIQRKSKKRILDLVKSTGTVVLVSHSFGLMTEICDRLVFIDKGKIVDVGKPEDIIKLYYEVTGDNLSEDAALILPPILGLDNDYSFIEELHNRWKNVKPDFKEG